MQAPYFFKYPENIKKRLNELKTKPAVYWENKGKKYVDNIINFVVKNVPAYRKFLKENGINYRKIKGFKDFNILPVSDKNNYLRKFNYLELFPQKNLIDSATVSATSGSTGEPFYFPRKIDDDEFHKYVVEIVFLNQWEIDKYSTLALLGFGLGIWIGGLISYRGFINLRKKGYKITTVPIGPNKELFLRAFSKFASFYDQIILAGYPPFIKDILDEGEELGINFGKHRIRIWNAAEGFSEEFRKYVARKAGLKDMLNDNFNLYGTVELGTMATETVFSNLIRNLAIEKQKIWNAIFPEANRLPTLAQYHPYIVWFEEKDGEVLASGYTTSIPLLRYRFPDRGGVIFFDDMVKRLKDVGVDVFKEAEKRGYKNKILRLPFVYVYERSDFAVSLVGILIYPEYIKLALQTPNLQKFLTGKFSMQTIYDKDQNQFLKIYIELKKGVKANRKLELETQKEILNSLLKRSTEYNHLYSTGSEKYKKQLLPIIEFRNYEDPQYFRPGIKQKWTIK